MPEIHVSISADEVIALSQMLSGLASERSGLLGLLQALVINTQRHADATDRLAKVAEEKAEGIHIHRPEAIEASDAPRPNLRPREFVRPAAAAEMIGLGVRRIKQLESAGDFPKSIQLNPPKGTARAYLLSEVEDWILARSGSREQ